MDSTFLSEAIAQGGEIVATLCGIAYVILAAREKATCWFFAFFGTFLFSLVFWNSALLFNSALNFYYMVMAVYGWWHWKGRRSSQETELPVESRTGLLHLWGVLAVIGLSAGSLYLLGDIYQGHLGALDALTTWGSVFATFLMARKIFQNWYWWIVIDSAYIYLYAENGLWFTVFLSVLYVVLAFYGLRRWKSAYLASKEVPVT